MNAQRLLGSALVAAVALVGCGGDSESGDTVPPDADLVVEAGPGIRFGSETYTATSGDVLVALVNNDSQRHTLLFVDGDGRTVPGHLEVGTSGSVDSRDYEFAPGEYRMICDVPGHENMTATLTVD